MKPELGGDRLREPAKREQAAAREKRIGAEATRIRTMLRKGGIDEDRLKGCDGIVKRAAFYAVSCSDLEDAINRDGTKDEYQNGENQWGTKVNPDVQTQATFSKCYLSAMKQLIDLLPSSADKPKTADEVMEFIGR